MKIKTMELTGAALDWAVTRIEHPEYPLDVTIEYSKDWDYGGPIIERWVSDLSQRGEWYAQIQINDVPEYAQATGPTPLVAAMRCYVASQLGDEVDVPDELKGESK